MASRQTVQKDSALKSSVQGFVLALMVLVLTPAIAEAQMTGNTGSGNSGSGFGQFLHGLNPANWKAPSMSLPKMQMPKMQMPKLQMPKMGSILPTQKEKKRVIQKKKSFVDEVSTTAKNSWKRTTEVLNPMNLVPASMKGGTKKKSGQSGFFGGMFSPASNITPSNQPPSTPAEFLGQEPIR